MKRNAKLKKNKKNKKKMMLISNSKFLLEEHLEKLGSCRVDFSFARNNQSYRLCEQCEVIKWIISRQQDRFNGSF